MSEKRSVVQAHHEEMTAIFAVLKTARRAIRGEVGVEALRQDVDDLDEVRARQLSQLEMQNNLRPAPQQEELSQAIEMRDGKPHRWARCPPGVRQCLACDRLGKHLEPIEEKAKVDEQRISDAHADGDRQAEGREDRNSVRLTTSAVGGDQPRPFERDVNRANEAGRSVLLREEGDGDSAGQQHSEGVSDEHLPETFLAARHRAQAAEKVLEGVSQRLGLARKEMRWIISYLAHNDQDANHAWMVRRLRAVLVGKSPQEVAPWTEHDGMRRREAIVPDEGHPHLIKGEFQSDKYPTTPRGKVPLSVKDKSAQDLLWEYAQRRREKDPQFSNDLEIALRSAGYELEKKVRRLGFNLVIDIRGSNSFVVPIDVREEDFDRLRELQSQQPIGAFLTLTPREAIPAQPRCTCPYPPDVADARGGVTAVIDPACFKHGKQA